MSPLDSIPEIWLDWLIQLVRLLLFISVIMLFVLGRRNAEKQDSRQALRLGVFMLVGGVVGLIFLEEGLVTLWYGYHRGGTEGLFCALIATVIGMLVGLTWHLLSLEFTAVSGEAIVKDDSMSDKPKPQLRGRIQFFAIRLLAISMGVWLLLHATSTFDYILGFAMLVIGGYSSKNQNT